MFSEECSTARISKSTIYFPMKTQKGIREHEADELRKAKRLEPLRKSGKERHALFSSFDEDDDESLTPFVKRESVLDYLDEEEE